MEYSSQQGLLALPTELLNQILSHFLPHTWCPKNIPSLPMWYRRPITVMLICRRLYTVARDMLYRTNTFRIDIHPKGIEFVFHEDIAAPLVTMQTPGDNLRIWEIGFRNTRHEDFVEYFPLSSTRVLMGKFAVRIVTLDMYSLLEKDCVRDNYALTQSLHTQVERFCRLVVSDTSDQKAQDGSSPSEARGHCRTGTTSDGSLGPIEYITAPLRALGPRLVEIEYCRRPGYPIVDQTVTEIW